MSNIFTFENFSFIYPEEEIPALLNLNFSVSSGDFLLICGPSGCGKSTLLRQMKTSLCPSGRKDGKVLFCGTELDRVDERTQAKSIGFVLQSPEDQTVTDKVWHELAFGLESLGTEQSQIRKRVAETTAFFGIENWFYKNTDELSGGQKQLLALASVMVMQPDVLILDEPTARLDPISAQEFISFLARINRELATTVIISEHRIEELSPFITKAAVMENGRIITEGDLKTVGYELKKQSSDMFFAMPCAMRVWSELKQNETCPITVNEGRDFLFSYSKNNPFFPIRKKEKTEADETVLKARNLKFSYGENSQLVLDDFSVSLHRGEIYALLGGNGAGKTTALKVLAGIQKPITGKIQRNGKIALLPQDVKTLFVGKTVLEDLFYAAELSGISKSKREERINRIADICEISDLIYRHPYDISGGEQQRAALAKLLVTDPDILLLDEPTKGFDAAYKIKFGKIIRKLASYGKALIIVSHDTDFCARYADECGLFFCGNIVSSGTPADFFDENSFYTTPASRMSRNIIKGAVTPEDIIAAFNGPHTDDGENEDKTDGLCTPLHENDILPKDKNKSKKLSLKRKISATFFSLVSLVLFIYLIRFNDISAVLTKAGLSKLFLNQMLLNALLIVSLFGVAFSVGRRTPPLCNLQTDREKRKLGKRTAVSCFLILIAIPLTVFAGIYYFDDRSYGLISVIILIECMLPFFMIFEGRKPKARELVTVSTLCALGVAGRAVFYMLPQFKPVMALTIISGVAFGGETGFIVGAFSMLASNMLFSQGPWTPWQMFAMGIIGFISGILFRKGFLLRDRISLSIFGALNAVVIYGGIMNPASVLMWSPASFNAKTVIASYISGLPMDLIHAFATAFFLYVLSEPMLSKLDRLKVKYGITG